MTNASAKYIISMKTDNYVTLIRHMSTRVNSAN